MNSKIKIQKSKEEKTLIDEIRETIYHFPQNTQIKNILAFICLLILCIFHFYYVTIFTIVYRNCLKKVFFSSLIVMGINIIYPCIICLLAVTARYFGLNCGFASYYSLSQILYLI